MNIVSSLGIGLVGFTGIFILATFGTWLICYLAGETEEEKQASRKAYHEADDIYSVVVQHVGTHVNSVAVARSYKTMAQAVLAAKRLNDNSAAHNTGRSGVIHVYYTVYKNKLED
jgi:hypothetical protein